MRFDWEKFRHRHAYVFGLLVTLKKLRVKVAVLLAAACVVEGIYFNERPLDLDEPNARVFLAIALILGGLTFRIAALGCIQKRMILATAGVYSLCRHPLYLGSILLTYGFCVLLNDPPNFVVATSYFVAFYPLTIIWEEVRLEERYGEAHRRYSQTTPLFLPLGPFRRNGFRWATAMRAGGAVLLVFVFVALLGIEVMEQVL